MSTPSGVSDAWCEITVEMPGNDMAGLMMGDYERAEADRHDLTTAAAVDAALGVTGDPQ